MRRTTRSVSRDCLRRLSLRHLTGVRTFLVIAIICGGFALDAPPLTLNHHHKQQQLAPEPLTLEADSSPPSWSFPGHKAGQNADPTAVGAAAAPAQTGAVGVLETTWNTYFIYFMVVISLILLLICVWTFRKHLKPCVAATEEGCATVVAWLFKPVLMFWHLIEWIFYHLKQNIVDCFGALRLFCYPASRTI
eukprot:gb/GEZN01016145.1/.p1 GENE.gb/GEZN01016145.1/~~gb/GEZN01016145.1/.p1  ORF type:complete len:192 (+),score=10.05 gb/GEZN01016145.1/:99-674(+)